MNDLVPVIGVSSILIVIFAFIGFLRYISYKETLALAEKGLVRPEQKATKGILRWGVVIAALGLAFTLGLYPFGFASGEEYPLHLGPWMLVGFVPLFLGLGLILLHYLTNRE
jgi:sterol desaturase/sphingolipid hydroxylase (fatty acid hydroxylase superfamily)